MTLLWLVAVLVIVLVAVLAMRWWGKARLQAWSQAVATAGGTAQLVLVDPTAIHIGGTPARARPRRAKGCLLLSHSRLVFVSRLHHRQVTIPTNAIHEVAVVREHDGIHVGQPMIQVDWTDGTTSTSAAWIVSDPARWIAALGSHAPRSSGTFDPPGDRKGEPPA